MEKKVTKRNKKCNGKSLNIEIGAERTEFIIMF